MRIIIGSDHAGFDLKELCYRHLEKYSDFIIKDVGVYSTDSCDYPIIAHQVSKAVVKGEYDRGLLICGTGLGMSMTANKYSGIRAALCHNLYTVRMSRLHNNANILVMGSRVIGVGIAIEMLDLFLETGFEGGRHLNRVKQINRKV